MAQTFSAEDQLPNLTVPPLESTIQKYLDSVRAVASDEEFKITSQLCEDFLCAEGPFLDSKLKELEKVHRNWIEKIWLDSGYLEFRLPLTYMNFAGTTSFTELCWPAQEGTQIERAALDLHILGKFWKMLRNEEIPPHKSHAGVPFSMHQLRLAFNTCRVPHRKKDELINYFKTAKEGEAPSHSVVIHQGRIFKINLISNKTDEPYTPPQFAKTLQSIVDQCKRLSTAAPGISALTSLDRDTWADIRDHLMSMSALNRENLTAIQSAINVISLDDTRPLNFSEMMKYAMMGDPTQRWLDKSYNSIWGSNGTFMASAEHTAVDGMVLVMYNEFTAMQLIQCGGKWTGSMATDDVSTVEELKFNTDKRITKAISEGKKSAQQLREGCEVAVPIFDKFGKIELKGCQAYPDAFVQICLQLAFMRLYHRPASTYETATTRQFYHGRTETCRTCTPELVAFCRAVIHGKPKTEVLSLLHAAHEKSIALLRDCQNNRGCDRHLLGLYVTADKAGMAIPNLFADPMYCKSGGGGNFLLSTSFVGFYGSSGGTPPMTRDGYGVFYRINDHRIVYTITAWNESVLTDVEQMGSSIERAFVDVIEMFRSMKEARL